MDSKKNFRENSHFCEKYYDNISLHILVNCNFDTEMRIFSEMPKFSQILRKCVKLVEKFSETAGHQ